ncbi:MAG: hypothetical protein Q9223_003766, partial [Gallowayella weberi]
MARKPQCQPPLVSVIHHDVGEDRSISIDVFLRSIKRVPSKGFSDRRILKRQRISPPSKSQLDIPNTSSDTQLLLADEIPEHQPPSEQNHDIVIAPQGLGDLEHRRPARKPLNEIRHNVRLSQRRSIDPKEFKFPPRTPANVKPVTWRLGSGFKRLPRLQQKMLSPVRNKKTRSGINRSARQIQVTRNASSIPQIRAQGVPITAAIEDIEDARDPEPPTSMVSPNAR